jgi:CPA2 family monovalent cation:H+ antiporter-2
LVEISAPIRYDLFSTSHHQIGGHMIFPILAAAGPELALTLIELGAAIVGLALLAHLAYHWGFSSIPLFLLAGLAFGNGGLLPLNLSEDFIGIGAEIGVILLMFMLGLEYTGEELAASLKKGLPNGLLDLVLNFTPGLLAGLIMGWDVLASVLLGGVTWISSSGVASRLLTELNGPSNRETPLIVSILVLEDLAMAVYLPLIAVLLIGQSVLQGMVSVGIALLTVAVVLFVAIRYGKPLSKILSHHPDETVLLTTFGLVLLVSGIAQSLQVSAAVGAFLVGIAVSGPLAEQAHRLISPLRDLFAAVFFFFFGLQIDPAALPPVAFSALLLGIVTVASKVLTGWLAAKRAGLGHTEGLRAGIILLARGEFSIVVAGLGVTAGIQPFLGPLSAAYVLLMMILGPLLALVFSRVTANAQSPEPVS